MKIRYFTILLLLITSQLPAQCVIEHWSLDKRIQKSDLIVEGQLIDQECRWDAAHQNIYTINKVEVYRYFKGQQDKDRISFVTMGGSIGLEKHVAYPSLQLSVGQKGIFLLEYNTLKFNDYTDLFAPVASTQSFIEYNLNDVVAYDEEQHFYSITYDLYNRIAGSTGEKIIVRKDFDPEKGRRLRALATPVISSIDIDTLSSGTGTVLTISGSNFGPVRGNGKVGFKNSDYGDGRYYYPPITESYVSWSNSTIKVVVPTKAGTGPIQVVTNFNETGESSFDLNVKWAHSNLTYFTQSVDTALYEIQHSDLNGNGGYTWQMTDQFSANQDAEMSFIRSLETWRCGTLMNWEIGTDTSLDATASDGVNIVRFDDLSGNRLGTCWSRFQGCYNNQLGEFYWYVNELDIEFDSLYSWYYGTGSTPSNLMDFQSVATHELGHGHQLNHVRDASKIMHFSIGAGDRKSVLHEYDVEGGEYVRDKSSTTAICNKGKLQVLSAGNCQITLPVVKFDISDTVVCQGSVVTFTNQTSGSNNNYKWDFGLGASTASSTEEGPHTESYDTFGFKTVKLVVQNNFGKDSLERTLEVLPPRPLAAEPFIDMDTACLGLNRYTVDSVQYATNYAWAVSSGGSFDGASTGKTVKVNWTLSGMQTVMVVAINECGNSPQTVDTINILDAPVASFQTAEDGLGVSFSAQSASYYLWDFGDGDTSTEANPVHFYGDKGSYDVKLLVSNFCGKDSLTKTVNVNFRAGLSELDQQVRLYPNPVESGGVLQLSAHDIEAFTMTDAQGRVIRSEKRPTNSIILPKLAAGLYVVSIQRTSSTQTVRLVVKHQ